MRVQTPIDDWEVLDLLTSLADKSLVLAEEAQGETRYRMLETLRQYGVEKQEADAVQARHLDYFVAFAEEAGPQLLGPEQLVWLNRLETEHDNVRSALDWGSSATKVASDSMSQAVRLVGAMGRFWSLRGYVGEGRKRLGSCGKTSHRRRHTKGTGSAGFCSRPYLGR